MLGRARNRRAARPSRRRRRRLPRPGARGTPRRAALARPARRGRADPPPATPPGPALGRRGTGLAPLRALVEQVAAAPDGRRVTLVVGARTFADLYDAISLDKLQCAHGWLTIVPAFSHDVFAEPAERGDALTLALDHHDPGQEVYVC
ncbi:hypothetical protein ACH4T9_11440 [Micromonospora sp. NPDC020750]|uniref:hypothetical protein n=1 Tax=unclassified Micromonospora TaxID=2617518 RepID=UPI003795B42E